MKKIFALFIFLFLVSCVDAAPLHFKITLDASAFKAPVSGRLLIFMTKAAGPTPALIQPNYADPNAVWISGTEISDLTPGKTIDIDPDSLSFPTPFASAPSGDYQIQALLDRDHSYTYDGAGKGDIYSAVQRTSMPADVAFTLAKTMGESDIHMPGNVRVVEFVSPMLSAFWGKPITMKASVALPPSYDNTKGTFPTVYSVHGFGGDHLKGLRGVTAIFDAMQKGTRPEMIYVYLDANCPLGHHVFADSVNNGPWGTALEKEFIPYLEKQFRMDAKPSGRFLTGHSSGGWTTLWVMITHPDFFGGTWPTSPDPVDFRSFTGPDLTTENPGNAYTDPSGKEYNLVRDHDKQLATVRQYAMQERVLGPYGGQFASFNAVFSPKGDDGQPMPLFDFSTGQIDPFVAKAWQKYNIAKVLKDNWKTLGPKLKGKIHITVGTADTFHLDEAVRLLDAELKELGSDAKFEYIPDKTHFDLYQGTGLADRIANEMYAIARPKNKTKTAAK